MGLVDTAFVKQFKDNITQLVQQKTSKLRNSVLVDTDFVGEFKFYDQLGKSELQEKVARHSDTPLSDPDHQRRRISKRDFENAHLFDNEDQLNMIVDPKSSYSMSLSMAAGRKMDDVIIEAFDAVAKSGKDGSVSTSFDSDFKIAAGGEPMTTDKVIEAKELLDDEDVELEDRTMVCAPKQISDLLKTTEATSSDFATVKALVRGEIDTWVGFKWVSISSQRLPLVSGSATDRFCYGYHKAAIQLGIQRESTVRIDERIDKSYSWQVFIQMSIGAVRLEEERIVQIRVVES